MATTTAWKNQLSPDQVVTRYATADIETLGLDPSTDPVVAIGIGLVDVLDQETTVDVLSLGGARGSEPTLIRRAFERINQFEPSALVTYNGSGFDLGYFDERINQLSFDHDPELNCAYHHIDLFDSRKQEAAAVGRKWPTLEEVLEAHGLTVEETEWQGEPMTNEIFGETFAPTYLRVLDRGVKARVDEYEQIIHQYTAGDVDANIALYEIDAGRR